MVVKIVAGVLGVLVIGVGAFVFHNYSGGCCSTESALTQHEVCPCDTAVATPDCCQQPSRGSMVSSHACCADIPVSSMKDGQEVLSIEPREVK